MAPLYLTLIKLLVFFGMLAGALYAILHAVDAGEIFRALSQLSWIIVGEAILLSLGMSLLQAWRFYLMAQKVHLNVTFWQATKAFLAGQATTVLPAGEVMRGMLLRWESKGDPITVSAPVISHGFVEVVSAAMVMAVGSISYQLFYREAILVFILLGIFWMFLVSDRWTKWLSTFLGRWQKTKFLGSMLVQVQDETRQTLLTPEKRIYGFTWKVLGLAALVHVIGGLLVFILARAVGAPLPILFCLLVYAATVVIQGVLAIIPGGLGVTEGGMVGLLRVWGMAWTPTLLLILLFRIATLLFPVLLGVLCCMIFYAKYLFKPISI